MAVINFFWDGDNLLQEYDYAGDNIAHYVTEPNQYGNVISQRRGGHSHYSHYDASGSTMELTNSSDDVSATRRVTVHAPASDGAG